MKNMKHFLFITLMITSISAIAQKGSFYIGGAAGFSANTIKDSENKSSEWTFSPEVGTWLSDNIQFGIGVKISGSKAVITPGENVKYTLTNTQTGATLYGRHFFKAGSQFRPFIGLNIDALPGKNKVEFERGGTDSETKTFTFGANLNAGFGYVITPKWSVLGSFGALGFSTTSFTPDGTSDKSVTNDFGFNASTLGNRFTIGFYYTL